MSIMCYHYILQVIFEDSDHMQNNFTIMRFMGKDPNQ